MYSRADMTGRTEIFYISYHIYGIAFTSEGKHGHICTVTE